ncbi:MAG: antitoxin component YwqK of YwqJK toxin-antitoxin module [Crocinitomicaceae bacterium]|jgi:antitoxin component YwqK of YwqJK toxin-antitoxin module
MLFLCLPAVSKAQSGQFHGGIDSTNNIMWWEQPSAPGITVRIETELIKSDYIVILNCDSSFWGEELIETPSSCLDYYMKNVNKISIDSLSGVFRNCIRDYFTANADFHNIDTIYIQNEFVFNWGKIPGMTSEESTYFTTKLEMYNQDLSYHTISCFYKISELKGTCISGDGNFRMKSIEGWEEGKKHGEWKFFDLAGKLTRLIEYDYGKIIQDITY